MEFFDQIAGWIRENPGKTTGVVIGFVAGILLFTLGWWKTLIVAVLVLAGYFIGKSHDDGVSIIDQITGFFRRNRD
jgi:uncharacterized membrane protein